MKHVKMMIHWLAGSSRTRKRTLFMLLWIAGCAWIAGIAGQAHAAAETALQVELHEAKQKQQFIVEGSSSDFDVDIVLPDGTKLLHTVEEPDKYLYIGIENKKIWVLLNAPAGTYTLDVTSSGEQSFTASTKEAMKKTETVWQSPKQKTVYIKQSTDRIPLSWQAGGAVRDEDQMKIYLQPKGTTLESEVVRVQLAADQTELLLPALVPDGEYKLIAKADNGTMEPQVLDPSVRVMVDRGQKPYPLTILQQFVQGGVLYVDVSMPKQAKWNTLHAELSRSSGGEPAVITADPSQLTELDGETDGTRVYRWAVTELTEDGDYSGTIYAADGDWAVSSVLQVNGITFVYRDGSDNQVTWSIEGDHTNMRYMDLLIKVPVDSDIALETENKQLAKMPIKSAEGTKTLQIALEDGDQLYELQIQDKYGNLHTYSKRLIVDHTAPRLEMIKPLPSHKNIPGHTVSGFVEAGAALMLGKQKVTVEPDGYFHISDVSGDFTLTATDPSGNVTEYKWKAQAGSSNWTKGLIALSILFAALTAAFIWWLRRTRTN